MRNWRCRNCNLVFVSEFRPGACPSCDSKCVDRDTTFCVGCGGSVFTDTVDGDWVIRTECPRCMTLPKPGGAANIGVPMTAILPSENNPLFRTSLPPSGIAEA